MEFKIFKYLFFVSILTAWPEVTGGQNGTRDLPGSSLILSYTMPSGETVWTQVNATTVIEPTAKYIWPGPGFQCLDASVCELTRSSIYKRVNIGNEENLKSANFYAEEYLKSQRLRDEKIDLKCGESATKCWKSAQSDASKLMSLPSKLATECDGSVLPNMLLLCGEESNGLEEWPQNIKYLFGNNTLDYKPCRSSCLQFIEYKGYHLKIGKKVEDFPKEFKNHLDMEEGVPEMRNKEMDKKVDKILFKTNSPYNMGTKRLQCAESTWVNGVTMHQRPPYGVHMHCQRLPEGGVVFSTQDLFSNAKQPLDTRNGTVNFKKTGGVDFPGSNYMIGLRLSKQERGGKPHYTGAGVKYAGSQYHNFIEGDTTGRYDWEMACPFRSAICSMEFSTFADEIYPKYVDIVSVGCCAMPIELYYSGVNATPYEPVTIQSSHLGGISTVGRSLNDYTLGFAHRGDKVLLPFKKTFLCKPGEFIVAMEQYMRLFIIGIGGPIPFLETQYYCGNGHGGPQTRLENGLYNFTAYDNRYPHGTTEQNRKIHEKYYPYKLKFDKRIECPSGFVNQYQISRYISGNKDKEYKSIDWAETIWCTPDAAKNYSAIKTWYLESDNDTNMDWCGYFKGKPICNFLEYDYWDTEVKCSLNEAVCGLEFRIDDDSRNIATIKVYKIRVVCCPIPKIWNQCCEAKDEYVLEARAGPRDEKFYFEPSSTSLHHKSVLVASVLRHLTPSKYTDAHWEDIIDKNYLKTTCGKEDKSVAVVGSEQKNECPPKRKVWRKFTITCADTTAIYYDGPKYVNETDIPCKNSKGDKCPNFCVASDEWRIHEKIVTIDVLESDEVFEDRSKGETCPRITFIPKIARDDYTYVQVQNAVQNQLSPSPTTGIHYKTYFEMYHAGKVDNGHSHDRDDVPNEHIKYIYQAVIKCGGYKAKIKEFKAVLYKIGDDVGNCEIAKTNRVSYYQDSQGNVVDCTKLH